MTLNDAIMALSPNHYWVWATAANQLSVSDSVGTLTFSSSVNDGGGFPGPEVNTLAQRLFSDQIWTTAALNANAWVGQTWLLVFSMQPNGSYSTYQDFLGWGDPNNRQARGFRIGSISNPINTGQFHLGGSATTFASQAIGFPQSGWHLAWWTIQPSPNTMSIQFDTASLTTNLNLPGLPPANTDQLWIQSQQPIIISHLASFNYVVTQTQMQPVAQQIVNWPTTVPINMPTQISGGGTTDLTPVLNDTAAIKANQSTFMPEIANINTIVPQIHTDTQTILPQTTLIPGIQTTTNATHTDTQNIVNTLFPQLETPINYIESTVTDILNGITSTITSAGGAISATVGKLFSQHSKDQLGTFNPTGGPTCVDIHWVAGVAAYWGCEVQITQYPSDWTFTTPADDWSIRDLAVLVIRIGTDQVARYGIHTLSFSVEPLPETLPVAVGGVGIPVTPPNYTFDVFWAGGVCGQLLLFYAP